MSTNLSDVFGSFATNNIIRYMDPTELVKAKSIPFSEMRAAADQSVESYRPPKDQLRALIGKKERYDETIGAHPDFSYLKLGETEHHYVVSVFADIQGSTLLGTKLPLDQVRFIKNGILTTAIDIFQAFDGHIHRLQGDAIFAFFGRKDMKKFDAIVDAINACSALQQFCKDTLIPAFESRGLPTVKIRAGVDFGDNDQVLWSHYGIKNCNEITTTSIYTDLAAKMQSRSPANGIIFGDNIRNFIDLPSEFYSVKTRIRNGELKEDRYIISNEYMVYPMWLLEWEKYLDKFIIFDRPSRYPYKAPKHFRFKCHYKLPGQEDYHSEYISNCSSLPKGTLLKFILEIPSFIRYKEIEWQVINRGKEATDAQSLNIPMDDYKNKTYCLQATAFKGHHYMQSTIKYQGRIIAQEQFGVYVRD